MFYGKMANFGKVIMAVTLISVMAFLVAGCGKFQAKKPYVPGEVLVQFDKGLSDAKIKEIISSVGATVKDTIKQQNVYVISFSSNISPQAMCEQLKKIKGVTWAEPNYLYEAFIFPISPAYAEEEYGLGIPTPSSKPVVVAVIDTGVNANNPSLAGKVTQGYNFYNNTSEASGSALGTGWHGTAVAGRVIDGAGGANIQIMPLQVNDGVSAFLSGSAILKAIYYAVDNGASVINMSFGTTAYSPLMQQAIDYAASKGVIMVAAAGNSGFNNNYYPAAYNNVIAIGATNAEGKMAGFSNFGKYVDLIAPGWLTKVLGYNGGEKISNGTSFSSPFIAGLAALFKYYFPNLTPAQVETELKALARNKDDLNPSKIGDMGAGFIGADDVLTLVASIKNGTFKLASTGGVGGTTGTATGPWLLRGKATEGTYILGPDGTLIKQK